MLVLLYKTVGALLFTIQCSPAVTVEQFENAVRVASFCTDAKNTAVRWAQVEVVDAVFAQENLKGLQGA